MKNSYKVGWAVRLRLPNTYGVISEVIKGPVFDEEPTYRKGGIIVQSMTPLKTIDGELLELDYYFENPMFSWMVNPINPQEEIARLR